MSALYYFIVTIHVLAALFWLGGMFFLALVGAPVLRAVDPPALRQQLFQELGSRFRSVGWLAIGGLIITGIINLYFCGWLRRDGVLNSPAFWRTGTGHALAGKLLAVETMLMVSAVHDFILGPAAGHADPSSARALMLRKRAARLARVNALLGIVVVVAAVRLTRGG